jgi:hypothetical protein
MEVERQPWLFNMVQKCKFGLRFYEDGQKYKTKKNTENMIIFRSPKFHVLCNLCKLYNMDQSQL